MDYKLYKILYFFIFAFLLISTIYSAELDDHDEHDEHEEEHVHEEEEDDSMSLKNQWIYGLLYGTICSLLGFFCSILFVYFLRHAKQIYNTILYCSMAFGAGALFGCAIIHQAPHLFSTDGSHSHRILHGDDDTDEEGVDKRLITMCVVLGLAIFVTIDKVIQNITISLNKGTDENAKQIIETDQQQIALQVIETKEKDLEKKSTENSEKHSRWSDKKTVAWLNLITDFIHNILDGLALGVAATSKNKADLTNNFIAIALHEIPQEIGDSALLLESNFLPWQVITCNGTVNFTALIGVIIGIAAGNINLKVRECLQGFIMGNFLYLSLMIMLPFVSQKENLTSKEFVLYMTLFLCGCGIMYGVNEVLEA